MELPIIDTQRCILTVLSPDQAPLLLDYYNSNRAHLKRWEPLRDDEFYTLEASARRLQNAREQFAAGTGVHFAVLDASGTRMIGACNFTNVVRGVFQACHLGYSLAAARQRQGLMHEALQAGINYMFGAWKLRRIMANYIDGNERSARVLERLGFEREGHGREYLCIDGRWQDHVLTSLINRRHVQ